MRNRKEKRMDLAENEIIVGGEKFELINVGTELEFVKGCMGNRYKEACLREEGMTVIHPILVKSKEKK